MQLDVRTATGHVGRDGDAARLTGARDDLSLLAILSRVENHRVKPDLGEQLRDMLGSFDRAGSDQHGAACARCGTSGADHGVPFVLSRWQYACARICPP